MRRDLLALVLAIGAMAGCISTAPPAASPLAAGGAASGAAPAAPAAPTTSTSGSGTTVNVAGPSTPCCPHQTLWQFLGLKGAFTDIAKLIEALRNCLGSSFPGLESIPPLTAITNPANMNSSNPAIAAAANAKADEDQAGQKIKAIRYLATLGCSGCYPDIEDALLAALDDCTEAVRYEAAKAFRELSGSSCATCKTKSCCSPKVRKKLDEVANKMVNGCYKESSARVRRMARLALAGCGGGTAPTPAAAPQEGPSEAPQGKGPAKTASTDDATAKALAALTSDTGASADAGAAAAAKKPLDAGSRSIAASDVKQAAAQISVSQTPTECNCGTTQSTSVFIPSSPAASNQQPTPAPVDGSALSKPAGAVSNANAPSDTGLSSVANSIPTLATSFIRFALPGPADADPNGVDPPAPTSVAAKPMPASVVHKAAPATGAVIAQVNGQPVFESEVVPDADRQLADLPGTPPAEKVRIRPEFIRRQLLHVIDRKLLAQEARRTASQIDRASFQSAGDDENALAAALMKTVVRVDTNVTTSQLWASYRANPARYTHPAEVRFEEVSIHVNRFASREAAVAAMMYVRNRAQGHPVGAAPANLDAIEVQTMGWTRRDDIGSPEAAALLFRLPIGGITPLLDDGEVLRMDRVLERRAAGPAPLDMVAGAVREQILRERQEYLEQAYLNQLRSRAQVWTIFDPPRAELNMVRPLDGVGQVNDTAVQR